MGAVLSAEEKKELLPHLKGFKPQTLSSIIWDTINLIGVDDQRENFGIHFDETKSKGSSKDGQEKDKETEPKSKEGTSKDGQEKDKETDTEQNQQQMVTFWDGQEAQTLPIHIFMDILTYVGEETIKDYEANHDLEKETEVQAGVEQLKLSLDYLKKKLGSMDRPETTEEYRARIDEGKNDSRQGSLVADVRKRRGTQMWSAGESRSPVEKVEKKGIECMMSRMPDLQKRFGSPQPSRFRRSAKNVQMLLQVSNMDGTSSRKESRPTSAASSRASSNTSTQLRKN